MAVGYRPKSYYQKINKLFLSASSFIKFKYLASVDKFNNFTESLNNSFIELSSISEIAKE